MENLTEEGHAIYDTIVKDAEVQHERQHSKLKALIAQSVNAAVKDAMTRTVDPMVRACVSKATADMQVYADGVESSLRTQFGLALTDEPDNYTKAPASDAETGPDGHRSAQTTRRPGVGPSGLYIPPPA